jgi:hypothetical protein
MKENTVDIKAAKGISEFFGEIIGDVRDLEKLLEEFRDKAEKADKVKAQIEEWIRNKTRISKLHMTVLYEILTGVHWEEVVKVIVKGAPP